MNWDKADWFIPFEPPTNSKLRSINVPHYKVRPCFITRAKQKIKKITNYNSTDDSSRPALLSRLPSHSSPQPARHTISLKRLTVVPKNRWLRHCSFDQPLRPFVYISASPTFFLRLRLRLRLSSPIPHPSAPQCYCQSCIFRVSDSPSFCCSRDRIRQ